MLIELQEKGTDRTQQERNCRKEKKEMIKTESLTVNGKPVQGVLLRAPGGEGHPNMIVLVCRKGYIMCGYLNQETAAKFGDAACVIGGSSFEEILANPVKAVLPEAGKLGVKEGMTGAEVCDILN